VTVSASHTVPSIELKAEDCTWSGSWLYGKTTYELPKEELRGQGKSQFGIEFPNRERYSMKMQVG
jgi:hypothetical protein